MNVSGLEPSRALDYEVAEKVMGWRRFDTWHDQARTRPSVEWFKPGQQHPSSRTPAFSREIAAAWLVVERMRQKPFSIRHRFVFDEMSRAVSNRIAANPGSGLSDGDRIQDAQAWFMAQPSDICLAALAALDVS